MLYVCLQLFVLCLDLSLQSVNLLTLILSNFAINGWLRRLLLLSYIAFIYSLMTVDILLFHSTRRSLPARCILLGCPLVIETDLSQSMSSFTHITLHQVFVFILLIILITPEQIRT